MEDTLKCNNACPACCDHTLIDEINARAEEKMRNRALTLSSVVAVLMLSAHVFFAYKGLVLPIPEIVWPIILAPWAGASGSKLLKLAKRE